MQRTATPLTPVRFRPQPPFLLICIDLIQSILTLDIDKDTASVLY